MLKITTRTGATGTIFELEGRLAGPWVQELESCWQRIIIRDQPIKIVLKGVTFIDSEGTKLLTEMHRQGAELAAEEFMMKAIIEEIIRGEDL